jgi:site-specific recombinase XerC
LPFPLSFISQENIAYTICFTPANLTDLAFHPQPTVRVMGKGRRERVLPLWKETVTTVRDWLKVRGEPKTTAVFLNARGDVMTRSGFEYILEKHVRTASIKQGSLVQKRVSPHSLRHSCAMHTLQATGDIRKVSLWLGHATLQSTEVYLRADPTEKLEAMASLVPPNSTTGPLPTAG